MTPRRIGIFAIALSAAARPLAACSSCAHVGARRLALVLLAPMLAACLGPLLPTCGDEERAAFEAVRHYEDRELTPEDHNTGACAGRFRTTDPDAVIEHYRAELEATGWEIGAPVTQPDGSPIHLPPGFLQAHRGGMAFSVEIVADGTDDGGVTVLVGRP